MASLPMWLEGILNKKYPEVARRRAQRRRLGALHAGRRCACSKPRCCARYPRRRHRRAAIPTTSTSSSARTRGSSRSRRTTRSASRSRPASTPRSSARRSSRSTRTTRASCSRAIKANPYRDELQGDRRRLGRLADHADQHLGRAERRLRRRGPQRVGGRRWSCSTRRFAAKTLPRADRRRAPDGPRRASSFPTSARRSASSR